MQSYDTYHGTLILALPRVCVSVYLGSLATPRLRGAMLPGALLEVPRENVWSPYLSRRIGGRIACRADGEAPRRRHVRRRPVVQSPKDTGRAARPARRLVEQ